MSVEHEGIAIPIDLELKWAKEILIEQNKHLAKLIAENSKLREDLREGKIISTDDACNWNLTVGALKDYDHVYVNGIRYVEFQPDINIQYLLDQVSRLTAENAMLKEKWSAPKREPLTQQQISEGNQSMFNVTREAFVKGVKWAEQQHGIGGEPLSNEQKRLEVIAIKQREAHGIGGGE